MSTYDDYRTIDITIDGVNDYPAQIIVSTGDTDGRRIRAKFLVDGTPVTDATGAAIYYGSDNVPADSVAMTEETDGVYTGVIPTAAYAGKACATVTVGLKKGASIVMSRSIRLIIDHAFGDDAPDNIDGGQLEDAINRAETAADEAEDSATAAKTSETNAKNSANSAASSASTAQAAKNSATASATAAKASETNAKTSENNAKASATAAKNSEANAKTSENNAKTSETKAAQSAKTAQTAAETAQEIADNFGVTASATASEPGGAASVNVTKKGTSYDLAFTIPRGPQGPKGDPGDLTTVTHDATLTGAGTASDVLKVSAGFYADAVDIGNSRKLDDLTASGVYKIMEYRGEDSPLPGFSITAIVVVTNAGSSVSQSAMVLWSDHASSAVYVRSKVAGSWLKWVEHGDFARTVSNPYKYTSGTIDLNSIFRDGAYAFGGEVKITNGPQGADYGNYIRGLLIHSNCTYQGGAGVSIQIWANRAGTVGNPFLAMRLLVAVGSWSDWEKFAFTGDLSNYVPLSTYRALETRVKALEAKLENQ